MSTMKVSNPQTLLLGSTNSILTFWQCYCYLVVFVNMHYYLVYVPVFWLSYFI